MAEVLGLTGSILALARTAWTVAKGLHDLATEVSSAGEAVRIFANDFWLFVETLKVLADVLDGMPLLPRRVESTTEELLEVALEKVVIPFRELLAELDPLLAHWRHSPSRMRQLGTRIRWAFTYKNKVLFHHAALNALKGNVSLLLQAMSVLGNNPPHIRFILLKSIKDTKYGLLGELKPRNPTLLRSGSDDGRGRRLTEPRSGQRLTPLPADSALSAPWRSRRQPSTEMALALVTDVDDPDAADEIAESLQGVTFLGPDGMEGTEQLEREQEEQIEAFGTILAVQRKVIRLADETTPAAEPIALPALPPANFRDGSALTQEIDGEDAVFSRTSEETSSLEVSAVPTPQPRAENRTARRSNAPVTRRQDRSVAAEDGILYFTDTLGSSFEIPWKTVDTWIAIYTFIYSEYRQLRVGDLVHAGRVGSDAYVSDSFTAIKKIQTAIESQAFTLMYIENEAPLKMVFHHNWDALVKPGWKVSLQMDDPGLARYIREPSCRNPSLRLIRLVKLAATAAKMNRDDRGDAFPAPTPLPAASPTPSRGPARDQEKVQRGKFAGFRDKLVGLKRA